MCDPVTLIVGGLLIDEVANDGQLRKDVVNFVVDDVLEPIAKTVGNVIESALDDPLKTIAQIAAVATGNAWALPLIEGADVAAKGGDIGDVLEATAKAYVVQQVGTYVGKAAGTYAGEVAGGLEYADDAARIAAQKLAENVVGAAAGSAAVAVVTGQDPVQALVRGGISAGVPALLGRVTGFEQFAKQNKVAANVISSAVTSALTGQNPTQAVVQSLIASSGLVQDAIKQFDPDGTKLDKAQTAIITDVLMGTATAAIAGGNPSNVVRAALMKAGSKALGDMVSDRFKSATSAATTAYEKAEDKTVELEQNEAAQTEAAANYNNIRDQLQIRLDEQNRLIQVAADAKAALEADSTNQSKYDAAVAAKKAADDYITALNKDYAETFRPSLDTYGGTLDKLKQTHATLTGDYESLVQAFATKTDTLSAELDPLLLTTNRAFVEALDPNFNADQYKRINGLGDDVDVYEHYLATGQMQGLVTNDKDKAIADEAAKFKQTTGVDLPTHVVERARKVDNANRDAVVKEYVDNTVADKAKFNATRTAAINTVLDSYAQAGYSQKQIDHLISSGAANTFVDQIMSQKRGSVDQLRDYARAVHDEKGPDSAEYKTAYRNALNAMVDYGGYGIIKDSSGNYISTEQGKLDPNTLVPVSKDRWGIDPVTGQMWIEITGIGQSQQMEPLSKLKDYGALWSSGRSANPPETGGSSIFGDGSGASSGLFGGLQLVAIDDKSGDASAKLYDAGNGFALIAYSDGTGRVINRNTNEVIWLDNTDTQRILKEVPQTTAPTLTPPPKVDTSKPPPSFSSAASVINNAVNEAIGEGATVAPTPAGGTPSSGGAVSGGGATSGGYSWNNISGGATGGGATGGGSTGGGAATGDTNAGVTTPATTLTADQKAAYDAMTAGQKLVFDQLLRQNVDITTAIGTAQRATNLQLAGLSSQMQSVYDGLSEGQKALVNQLSQQGVDVTAAVIRAQNVTGTQIAGLSEQSKAQYNNLTAGQKAIVDQLAQQGVDLTSAIIRAQNVTGTQIAGVAGQVGDLSRQVTGLSTDLQSKYNSLTAGQKDLADQLAKQGVDLNTAISTAAAATAQGFENVYGQMSANQAATQQAISAAAAATQAKAAAEAERTRQANAQTALQTQRMGNLNTLLGMVTQAPDVTGQQVTVKAADPSKIGYIYDWNSIFANPSQEKMFVSPYGGFAAGGTVDADIFDANEELLKILRG